MPRASDALLVERIRAGQADAWADLINLYEGRLLAFVATRLNDKTASEDVVQESFLGFLNSLPNYDVAQSLENYLFSIAAHKLTDHLRRNGRRPAVGLPGGSSAGFDKLPGSARPASSLARGGEQRHREEQALSAALAEVLEGWRAGGQWQRVAVAELLFLRGQSNPEAARHTGLSEQQVANQRFEFVARLRSSLRRQGLPEELFPDEPGKPR
ncbi:MAG: sigma-70 family RNA polymerase sigma factor [Planctomycetes bacterium]|nr:sigma-70 family RNA polymerase sigma factor [Planctomycetota bacterium]